MTGENPTRRDLGPLIAVLVPFRVVDRVAEATVRTVTVRDGFQ